MLGHHDIMQRRPRDTRVSTGKRIQPQDRDLIWFEQINRHGPLPSSYLHAFTEHLPECTNQTRAIKRMGDLFHEDNTPHGGAYLDRAWQQFETMNARYQEAVSELTPHSGEALRERGRYRTIYNEAGMYSGPEREWKHRLMTGQRDRACRFVHQDELFAEAPVSTRALPNPLHIPHEHSFFAPDQLFAIEYARHGKRLMGVEAERTRKTLETSNFKRKSYIRSFLQWREFIGSGRYRDYFGVTGGMVVLYVFPDAALMKSAMDLLLEMTEGKGNTFILFKAIPEFGRYFRVPKPKLDLFTAPWARAGRPEFQISLPQ
jgi:hypothetical protein